MVGSEGISCCFDEESSRMLDDYRKKGLDKASKTLLSELISLGLAGSTTLELGCGVGALTLSMIEAGVTSAVGIDLSPKMVEIAQGLASEKGVSSKVEFRVGDGAQMKLEGADFVILDSVLCCYPDVMALIENTSSAAAKFVAVSLPDSRRVGSKLLRPFLPLQWIFLRKTGFRFFIPDMRRVMNQLQKKGFVSVFDSKAGRSWSVLVFAAQAAS